MIVIVCVFLCEGYLILHSLTGQLSEGIEHRIGIMETSLNKLALILDSIQSDVMQVNKGTKEVTLESK